jgi:hypothetical protein
VGYGNLVRGGDCEIRRDIAKCKLAIVSAKYFSGRARARGQGERQGACSMSIGEEDRHVGV